MTDPTQAPFWRDFELDKHFSGAGAKPFVELAVLASMVAAAADGSAQAEEYDHIVTMVELGTKGTVDRDRIDTLVQRAIAKIEEDDLEGLIAEVKTRVTDKKSARAALAFAVSCAFSDGSVSDEEKTTLADLATALGVDANIDDVIRGVFPR